MRDNGTVHFGRSGEAEQAFQTSNDVICKVPILAQPNEEGEYVLHSETREHAGGAVQSKKREDSVTGVIAFWSRKIKSVETQYPTCDRKLIAIWDAVVNWHYYLHSDRTFTVHMDHASLRHILTYTDTTSTHSIKNGVLSNFTKLYIGHLVHPRNEEPSN